MKILLRLLLLVVVGWLYGCQQCDDKKELHINSHLRP